MQRVAGVVVLAAQLHAGRTRLAVPALKRLEVLRQRAVGVGVCHGLGKVVAGHGLAVVPFKVARHALGKAVAAHQGLHHAHHLGAFFVNGQGVKVVDFGVLVGAYRVRHGAGVFGKLRAAQQPHILNALDRASRVAAGHVLAKFLVAKYRQAFFE